MQETEEFKGKGRKSDIKLLKRVWGHLRFHLLADVIRHVVKIGAQLPWWGGSGTGHHPEGMVDIRGASDTPHLEFVATFNASSQ